jgi:pimeloyl-ACP methyl ester carboxylesterase
VRVLTGRSGFFAASDGVRLHLRRFGDPEAPLVILLHGGGANTCWWDPIARRLAEDFDVVALDFRGHGASDQPEPEVGAFARDVASLVAHLGRRPRFLVGHSLGAHVGLDHASHQEGVRGLVAIEASRGAAPGERRRTRLALAARRTYATREEAIARFRFLPAAPGVAEDLRRHIASHSLRKQADGRLAYAFDPRWFRLPPAPAPPLERVRCPVLLLRGSESALLTDEGARELAGELPFARVEVIRGASSPPSS